MTEENPRTITVNTNGYVMSVSREMAIDHGLVQATPEEIAERNESSKRFHAEQKALRKAFKTWIETWIEPPFRGLAKDILDFHAPDDGNYDVTCKGCPHDRESGAQDWPCETVGVVAEWARHPLPGGTMPSKRYEDEWTPWDGKPFVLPRLESFATLDGTPFRLPRSESSFVTLDPDDIGGAAE